MKILIVCPYFPPEGEIAALRIGKFAEYWAKSGHEIEVLTRVAVTNETEAPQVANIHVVRVKDPNGWAHAVYNSSKGDKLHSGIGKKLVEFLKKLVFIPDKFVRWGFLAYRVNSMSTFQPDVVVASGGPITALLVGALIARRSHAKLVLDYRDLLATTPRYPLGQMRKFTDLFIEKFALKRADLIAAASHGCAENLRAYFTGKVVVIENGFEELDYLNSEYRPIGRGLNVVYTGTVYENESDLSPFFEAVSRILNSNKDVEIRLNFYGRPRSHNTLREWASAAGVEHVLVDNGMVTHREIIQIQSNADLLLLLMWEDAPENHWVLSGKYYEYLGARRPILQVGLESGELAMRIRNHELGIATSRVSDIEEFLEKMIAVKTAQGFIQGPSSDERFKFTRKVQSELFLSQLDQLIC